MQSHAGSDQWPVDISTCPFEYQPSHSLWKEKETKALWYTRRRRHSGAESSSSYITIRNDIKSDSSLEQTHSYIGRASIVGTIVAYAHTQLSKPLKISFLIRLFLKFKKYSLFDGGKSEHRCTYPRLDFVTGE